MSFGLHYVKCGKRNCRSCPHGPYWYQYSWNAAHHKMESRYWGKRHPETQQTAAEFAEDPVNNRDGWQAGAISPENPKQSKIHHLVFHCSSARYNPLLNPSTATRLLAAECLGVALPVSRQTLKKTYRDLAKLLHPDGGGTAAAFARATAAFTYLLATVR